jgi:hypothetical protein
MEGGEGEERKRALHKAVLRALTPGGRKSGM